MAIYKPATSVHCQKLCDVCWKLCGFKVDALIDKLTRQFKNTDNFCLNELSLK